MILKGHGVGIIQGNSFTHWNYFLTIEEDISHLSRWIEPTEANFECYSLEVARLLMVTAAEVDVLSKLVCRKINPASKATSINLYQNEIQAEFPQIHNATVSIPKFALTLKPWDSWSLVRTPPFWWQDYNKVKHHRSEHFHRATLKNLLNAVAALLLLEILYYQEQVSELTPLSKLFIPNSFCVRFEQGFMYFPNAV